MRNIIFYKDSLIVHGDSQVIQYDLKTGEFRHLFKQQTEVMTFSIGQVALENDTLYLSFRVYELQYLGILSLDEQQRAPQTWAAYIQYFSKSNAREVARLVRSDLSAESVRLMQVQFPESVKISTSASVEPLSLAVGHGLIVLGYTNCSHIIVFLQSEIEQEFRNLENAINAQVQSGRVGRKPEVQTIRLCQCEPYVLSVQAVQFPDSILDDPMYSADSLLISEAGVLQSQVQVEQFGNFKQALAYYDLGVIVSRQSPRVAEILPLSVIGLMGYCGAGLEQRLVRLHGRECWVVADPIRDLTVLERELISAQNLQNARTTVNDGDTMVYVLGQFGKLLKCVKLAGKSLASEAFVDMDTGPDGSVVVANSCGQVALFGVGPGDAPVSRTSQFFAVEAPGIRQYRNSE